MKYLSFDREFVKEWSEASDQSFFSLYHHHITLEDREEFGAWWWCERMPPLEEKVRRSIATGDHHSEEFIDMVEELVYEVTTNFNLRNM